MSLMCKMKERCCAKKGLCVHEKMMMGGVMLSVLLSAAAIAHWVLRLF